MTGCCGPIGRVSSPDIQQSRGKSRVASRAGLILVSPNFYSMKIYIDGKFYDQQNARISVFDHGLLYGDGVFEGIRAYHGRVFKLKEHIDRLFYSAKAILLNIPMSHAQLMKAVVDSCRENKIRDGYIRLIVTRGIGTLGL